MEENLNLDDNIRELVIKALNISTYQREAAERLGVGEHTLIRWKKHLNIIRIDNIWVVKPKRKIRQIA